MGDLVNALYERYFKDISQTLPRFGGRSILLTHVLPNQVKFFHAFSKIAPIEKLIAIPYSLDEATRQELAKYYRILTPTLEELLDANFLSKILLEATTTNPIIIQEIGGYFAKAICNLPENNRKRLHGVIEDTEAGHRIYEHLASLPCPVISIARSQLKSSEDALVGGSCIFSTEKILRNTGLRIEGKRALVLGYGKVGRGLAHALQRRSCAISVYDSNHVRMIQALGEGFSIPQKLTALASADLIFGATGNYSISGEDFLAIKNGAMLISCSSKDLEFDLPTLNNHYQVDNIREHIKRYKNEKNFFYLLGDGLPINFIDQSAIGPVLALCQAQMLLATKYLIDENRPAQLSQLNDSDDQLLAEKWLEHFCSPLTGHYQYE